MKRKHLFTYFGLAIVIATSMIIYSCQKEQTGFDKSENQTEQSLKDAQLEKRIIAFRDKIDQIRENPTLKSGNDPMEVDSTIWFIESISNLTYGDASCTLNVYVIDSSFIEVPLTNGKVSWDDLQDAYDKVVDSLSAHYSNISATQKQLIVADITLDETFSNKISIAVTSLFGTNRTTGLGSGNLYPWYWGWELGRCDTTAGLGYDAADKIAQLANALIPTHSGNSYYTDVSFQWVSYWDVPTNNNPYGDYLLFQDYQEVTLNHACLSTDEIGYYKSALITIGNMYKPTDKSVIIYLLWDDYASGLTPEFEDWWDMAHFAKVKYAIWHISNDPPSEL